MSADTGWENTPVATLAGQGNQCLQSWCLPWPHYNRAPFSPACEPNPSRSRHVHAWRFCRSTLIPKQALTALAGSFARAEAGAATRLSSLVLPIVTR